MGVMVRESPYSLSGVYTPAYFPVPQSTLGRSHLGLDVSPNLLLWGIGGLALVMFLLGLKAEPKIRRAKKARREKKIAKLRRKIKELEIGRIEDFEDE